VGLLEKPIPASYLGLSEPWEARCAAPQVG
jgi:hypothetical protein